MCVLSWKPAMSQTPPPTTYRDAGVDIDAGNSLVERIKPLAASTRRPEMLGGLGGFGALCALPSGYREPILVTGTDGVGTKLKLAQAQSRLDQIGIDLVAMCVNDLIVCGAEPLLFLDYYATGRLDVDAAESVISGIAAGCRDAGCALAGGETAEMPGMYQGSDFDLAGFCLGVVERDALIDGTEVRPGDQLIALPSSGPHSNGYSLIRKLLAQATAPLPEVDKVPLIDWLLTPTRIYVRTVRELLAREVEVRAIAHITGGGLLENLPRVLPAGASAHIDRDSWSLPQGFQWLQEAGRIPDAEMHRTFNCGIGLVLVVSAAQAKEALSSLQAMGEAPWILGEIRTGAVPVEITGCGPAS